MAQLRAKFRQEIQGKEVHVLDVPDIYGFMDPELIELLEAAVTPLLEARLATDGTWSVVRKTSITQRRLKSEISTRWMMHDASETL